MLELFRGSVGRHGSRWSPPMRLTATCDPSDASARPSQIEHQRALTGCGWTMVDEEHGVAVFDADVAACSTAGRRRRPPGGRRDRDSAADTHSRSGPATVRRSCCAATKEHSWRRMPAGKGWPPECSTWRSAYRRVVATASAAVLGPCIHAECYEFGPQPSSGRWPPGRRWWRPGCRGPRSRHHRLWAARLDVPAAVACALRRHHVELDTIGGCTACDPRSVLPPRPGRRRPPRRRRLDTTHPPLDGRRGPTSSPSVGRAVGDGACVP